MGPDKKTSGTSCSDDWYMFGSRAYVGPMPVPMKYSRPAGSLHWFVSGQ